MNLYRIILVDDEEEVRKAIIRKMNWNRLGFEVVGDAENGQDALEKIEQLEPDVVMTDIRMPYMDGLTLTRKIRQKYPSMKVLIFSGFDDFEYAQQAIKLNVTEYILKPVNGEELAEILTRVHENLDEEIEQRRNIDLLRESYQSSLPILKELFLNDLVRGIVPAAQIPGKMEEYNIDLGGARKWLTALIHIEQEELVSHQALAAHRELIPISVRNLVEDRLKPFCRFAMFNSNAGITLIAAIEGRVTQTDLISQLGDICKECRRVLEVPVTIAVGHSCMTLAELDHSYQSSVDALGYKAIVGTGGTIYINDVEPVSRGKLQLESKDESDLSAAIKFGPQENIRSVVHEIVGRMDGAKVHARQYQAYKMSMVNCIIQLAQQYDLNLGALLNHDQYVGLLADSEGWEEFEAW